MLQFCYNFVTILFVLSDKFTILHIENVLFFAHTFFFVFVCWIFRVAVRCLARARIFIYINKNTGYGLRCTATLDFFPVGCARHRWTYFLLAEVKASRTRRRVLLLASSSVMRLSFSSMRA